MQQQKNGHNLAKSLFSITQLDTHLGKSYKEIGCSLTQLTKKKNIWVLLNYFEPLIK